jgi:C-terminal processing protease CtpA/Prc
MNRNLLIAGALTVAALVGCTNSTNTPVHTVSADTPQLRSLRTDEVLADFDMMIAQFRTFYGPLEYKEARFGWKFDELATEYRAKLGTATTHAEKMGVFKQFMTRLQDGHVSVQFKQLAESAKTYAIRIIVTPIEGQAVVAVTSPQLAELGIQRGDIVKSIDGRPTMDYLKDILKYESMANEVSNQHLIFKVFLRPFYMAELAPTKPTAMVEFQSAAGEAYSREITWQVQTEGDLPKYDLTLNKRNNYVSVGALELQAFEKMVNSDATVNEFGQETPFFVNDRTKRYFGLRQVKPNEEYLKKYGADVAKEPKLVLPGIFAALYKHKNKTILLVRQASYSNADNTLRSKYYRALLDQYEPFADVLVIDQTHNPGGSLDYAVDFFSLFVDGEAKNMINFLRADRQWIFKLNAWATETDPKLLSEEARQYLLAAKMVEKAYDEGKNLSEPVPLAGTKLISHTDYTWKKPVLVLADELAGSCGDIFPMLMKRNSVAPIFGQRTMGLGGNVEAIAPLQNSRMEIRLTRGLFTTWEPSGNYDAASFVENNGITPDLPFAISLRDFRMGYLEYVNAFSAAAAALAD